MFMMKGPHEEESTVSEWATRWGGGSPNCLPEFFIADPGAHMQIRLT